MARTLLVALCSLTRSGAGAFVSSRTFSRAGSSRSGTIRCGAPRTGKFELELFSPAKLNLFTRIICRHQDGTHDVAGLSQTISLGDRLLLARIPGDRLAAAGVVRPSRKQEPIKQHAELSVSAASDAVVLDDVPLDDSNTVVRAIALFRQKLTERDGGSLDVPRFRAHLVKAVPTDAGLAGSASNAATALWGVNELCGRPASLDELQVWALELSSDTCSFLVAQSGASYSHGRAMFHRPASVQPVAVLGSLPAKSNLVVIHPRSATVGAPALFRILRDSNYSTLSTIEPSALLNANLASEASASARFVNDLEVPAAMVAPQVQQLRKVLLARNFEFVAVSGAGPSLFALAPGSDVSSSPSEALTGSLVSKLAKDHLMDVDIWPASFVSRECGGWYVQNDT
jgi:4-diphosphocytidyl-2-C-methyl-D-erythritol kinase